MRIIAGQFRGRRLLPPPTDVTRPVTDRVKQSIFDILTPVIDGATIYDCFAGTGSMGLECLSRGAAHVTFFEADRGSSKRLKMNIQAVGAEERSTLIIGDLFRWFEDARPTRQPNLVFLDPPYRFIRERANDLRRLAVSLSERHLLPGGIVVLRNDAADSLDLPPLICQDRRQYGKMAVEFLTNRA